jgi:hypothetical protein
MGLVLRGIDDILIDNMVTTMRAFSAEQSAIDPGVAFDVERDIIRPPNALDIPLMNIWAESEEPQSGGSSAKITSQFLVKFNVDCYARGIVDNDTGDESTKAMVRLYYFKEQAKAGLYRLVNANFGMTTGTIGRKTWPRWSIFQNSFKLPEDAVVAGRLSFEMEVCWKPEDFSAPDLERITVDSTLWSAIYNY